MASKSDVQFVNLSKETKDTMTGLAKSALRESGKVVRKYLRSNVPVKSKRFKNHIASWVFVDKTTGQPQMQIGFYGWQRVKKRGKQPSNASPWWIEFGTKAHQITPNNAKALGYADNFFGSGVRHPGTKATNVLRNTVYDHVDDIRKAQETYLAELNKELDAAGAKIYNGEEEEDD